jgi:hypothetical protein
MRQLRIDALDMWVWIVSEYLPTSRVQPLREVCADFASNCGSQAAFKTSNAISQRSL